MAMRSGSQHTSGTQGKYELITAEASAMSDYNSFSAFHGLF
jgi:hypothetical protein